MVLFLPKVKSFGEEFGSAIGGGLGEGLKQGLGERTENRKLQKQNHAIEKAFPEAAGLPIELQKLYIAEKLQGKQQEEMQKQKYGFETQLQKDRYDLENKSKAQKLAGETQEKSAPFESALSTIDQMRKIGKKGNLGLGTGFKALFGGETARDRGEYETLGNSLISMASNIPIRNQQEFETLAGKIHDASLSDKEREGVLDALERIINQSLQQNKGESGLGSSSSKQKKPPLTSFLR